MSRRRRAVKREIYPDVQFSSRLVGRLVNTVMKCGKRSVAQRVVYGAFDQIVEKNEGATALEILERAVDNAKPRLEVKSRRVGGATYQVPVEVKPRRANTLAVRWLVDYARERRERSMSERLANEIMDAANGIGSSVKRREDLHKMAEANKAFAHYRW